jgi:HemY protein
MLKLTRQLEKRGGMPAEAAAAIRHKAHETALAQRQGDPAQLLAYFEGLRREERAPDLAYAVATSLSRSGDDEAAAKLVETALEEGEWSSDLVTLYGQLGVNAIQPDSQAASQQTARILTARIARADAWLAAHPDDSRLLLTLGRLCERQKLWGKAQNYLDASLALEASREGYLALARLLDALSETEAANRLFRKAAECDHSFA